MGIFFGANGSQSAGAAKRGWKSDKEAVRIANRGTTKSDFAIARAAAKKKEAAAKRKAAADAKKKGGK